jgi:hypothetical protein
MTAAFQGMIGQEAASQVNSGRLTTRSCNEELLPNIDGKGLFGSVFLELNDVVSGTKKLFRVKFLKNALL